MRIRAIRLPDRFYLPRTDADGREVRDVMPWEGAVSYATDGQRLGIQFEDGRVMWLGRAAAAEVQPPSAGSADGPGAPAPVPSLDAFAEDFEGVNMDALVEGLRNYIDLHPVLKTVWRDDLQALDALRGRAPHHGDEDADGA
ncbi:MAG TPA: hypothetical protein VF746_09635 [Longimicrobium sp.]|jgi:hypothetical protein